MINSYTTGVTHDCAVEYVCSTKEIFLQTSLAILKRTWELNRNPVNLNMSLVNRSLVNGFIGNPFDLTSCIHPDMGEHIEIK